MAESQWSGGVALFGGYGQRIKDSSLRLDMDNGPPQQRQKVQSTWRIYDVIYRFTASEYDGFLTWYNTTVENGNKTFNWLEPTSQSTIVVRMISGLFTASIVTTTASHFDVSMQLEEVVGAS